MARGEGRGGRGEGGGKSGSEDFAAHLACTPPRRLGLRLGFLLEACRGDQGRSGRLGEMIREIRGYDPGGSGEMIRGDPRRSEEIIRGDQGRSE